MSVHSHPLSSKPSAPPFAARMARGAREGAEWLRRGRGFGAAACLTLGVGLAVHFADAGQHAAHSLPPVLHWLRDSALALPLALLALWAMRVTVAHASASPLLRDRRAAAVAVGANLGALAFALASIPAMMLSAW